MALGSLLLFFALLIVVSLIAARPLVTEQVDETALPDSDSHWLAERERVLDALAELDADWQLGKVPEEVYAALREQLVAKGAQAIEQLNKGQRKARPAEGDELKQLILAYKRKIRK